MILSWTKREEQIQETHPIGWQHNSTFYPMHIFLSRVPLMYRNKLLSTCLPFCIHGVAYPSTSSSNDPLGQGRAIHIFKSSRPTVLSVLILLSKAFHVSVPSNEKQVGNYKHGQVIYPMRLLERASRRAPAGNYNLLIGQVLNSRRTQCKVM